MSGNEKFTERRWVRVSFAILAVGMLMYVCFLIGTWYAVYKVAGVLQEFPASLCVVNAYGTTIKPLGALMGENYTKQLKAYAENRCYEEYAIDPSVNSTTQQVT